MSKFIAKCIIRKDTPELREKLEELGYTKMIGYDTGFILVSDGVFFVPEGHKIQVSDDLGEYIDCGTNEDLFLALAALREDIDYMQWFTTHNDSYVETDDWYLCKDIYWELSLDMTCNISMVLAHKAPPAELIEHFKNNSI